MTIQQFRFQAMASSCEVRLDAPDLAAATWLANAAIDEVHRIEKKYSRYQNDSIVSRISAASGKSWVTCDTETLHLLDVAATLFRLSDGLFDVTSGVLRYAWDFKRAILPDSGTLNSLLKRVGWAKVERRGDAVRLGHVGMELDFGGFGKEYAADRAATVLAALGVTSGYVNLAGDIHVVGPKPDGSPWAIGIQHPRKPNAVMATIPVYAGALATSGDYERYFDLAGKRYCHILNPQTGWPITAWQSISVLESDTLTAGSLTTLALLKEGQALSFLQENKAVYLAVNAEGQVFRQGQTEPTPYQ